MRGVRNHSWIKAGAVAAAVLGVAVVPIAIDASSGDRDDSGGSSISSAPGAEPSEPSAVTTPSPVGDGMEIDGVPVEAPGEATEIPVGDVAPQDEVGDAERAVALGTERSQSGAVAAFTSYATWVLGSPAAGEDPEQAVELIADPEMSFGDKQTFINREWGASDSYQPSLGGYRVLAYSGDAEEPDSVMIEMVGPLTTVSGTRWVVVGGVVNWTQGAWRVFSLGPRELDQQPSSGEQSAEQMNAADQAAVFDGLGWKLFAGPSQD